MVVRGRALQVAKGGLGPVALAHPRKAATTAAILLGMVVLAWLIVAQPWSRVAEAPPAIPKVVSAAEITSLLSRSGYGPGGSDVRILWATPEYFRFTRQPALAAHYGVDRNLVFFLWENIHDSDLPEGGLRPVLRIDSAATYLPVQVLVPASAVHHRFSVVIFPREDTRGIPVVGEHSRSLELILPQANAEGARSILSWTLPVEYPRALSGGKFQFSGAAVLALLGGVLASMWPCLFQLTAYFIPTLAGISVSQAERKGREAVVRLQVMKSAAFFVLGFVIVYTLAGAAAGFAAQSLDGASLFWSWRRPLSFAAGLVILLMALRLAASARAPLVCRMPVASSLAEKRTGPLGTMLLGLAFAAGCTTCFGAALILGIVTYVGMAGTPLLGALIMFVFSLGMAIPLMAGALAMARVLGLLGRLEKVAPYMVLASSAIMVGFATLLLTGRYMALSNWVFSRAPF